MKWLWEKFMSLFGRKKPRFVTLHWSGIGLTPDTGSAQLGNGTGAVATTAWNIPGQAIPAGKLVSMTVTSSVPLEGGLTGLLYKLSGGAVVGGWCPSASLAPGETSTTLSLGNEVVPAGLEMIAWTGYPPGLGNTKTLDLHISVLVEVAQ